MSTANSRESSGHTRNVAPGLTVKNWPLRDGGFSAWTYAMFCVGLSCFAGYATASLLTALACFGFLLVASGRFWLPIHYSFQSKGVTIGYPTYETRLPWRRFRHAAIGSKGITLVLNDSITLIGTPQQYFVYWNGRQEEILSVVRAHLDSFVE